MIIGKICCHLNLPFFRPLTCSFTIPAYSELDDFYAKAIQEVLSADNRAMQQVPDVPIPQFSNGNDMDMFEVPTCKGIDQIYQVSVE